MEAAFWDESSLSTIKCEGGNPGTSSENKEEQGIYRFVEGNLNFSTAASEDDEFSYHKKKLSRDPLSHRIIEKRRRDRMNNCLADLSRLLPSEYMKKGRGRIEKTEIIEMAIKHMKHLQSHPCTEGGCCPVSQSEEGKSLVAEHYKIGFHDCLSETMHFLIEVEGFFASDTLCVQLVSHLHRHCDSVLKRESGGVGGSKDEADGEKMSECRVQELPGVDSAHLTNGSNSSPSPQSQGSVESSGGGASYKFKNSIRKRFATERARSSSGSCVPVFALSSRGGYYVPLSLDCTLLSPHMSDPPDDDPVLHPVTISVNFRPRR